MTLRTPATPLRLGRLATAVFLFLAQAVAFGQAPQLPTGKELAAKHVTAIGGAAAFKAIKSIRIRGQLELVGQAMSGDVELLAARPNKMLQRLTLPVIGKIETGYDGKIGWSIDPSTGPALLSGRQLIEMSDDSHFDSGLFEPDHIRELTTLELTEYAKRPAYKVKVVFVSGQDQIDYFDAELGWQIGTEGPKATVMGVVPTFTILRDYKKFGSVMQPSILSQQAMGIEQVLRVTSCEFDVVPESAFDPPPQVKALIKRDARR